MKRLMQMLVVVCMVLMSTQLVFANADKATIPEGADLTAVHRLAVAAPLYVEIKGTPTRAEVTQLIYDASKVARSYVMSYDMAAQNIKQDSNIDIKALDSRQAAKAFNENIGKYVDAYVVATVANNHHTVFFFDVYQAGTNALLYTYQVVADDPANILNYTAAAKEFYKNFESSAQAQQKKNEKVAKK
jgi:hypothetical protein